MIIRNISNQDESQVQEIVYTSLLSQFPLLSSQGVDKSTLTQLGLLPSKQDDGCFIAEEDGYIYGVICLRWSGNPSPLKKVSLASLTKKYGLKKGFQIWVGLRMITLTPLPGQCYVEHSWADERYMEVVIVEMLTYLENLAYQDGFIEMTKSSLPYNQQEIEIFGTLGFELVEERTSSFAKKILGRDTWQYYKKSLAT